MLRPQYLNVENPELTVRIDHFQVKKVLPALINMAINHFQIRFNTKGLIFYRLLGTGSGQTFTSRDADMHRWLILTVWPNYESAIGFEKHPIISKWKRNSLESASLFLSPLTSKGTWKGRKPFGEPIAHKWDGPVLSITRARIKTKMWRRFQSEVPPVSDSLHASAGLLTAFGIGEAPIGLQGTVSIWIDNKSLTQFAQRERAHREVISKTHELNWYSEELFARFAVFAVAGAINGVALASAISIK